MAATLRPGAAPRPTGAAVAAAVNVTTAGQRDPGGTLPRASFDVVPTSSPDTSTWLPGRAQVPPGAEILVHVDAITSRLDDGKWAVLTDDDGRDWIIPLDGYEMAAWVPNTSGQVVPQVYDAAWWRWQKQRARILAEHGWRTPPTWGVFCRMPAEAANKLAQWGVQPNPPDPLFRLVLVACPWTRTATVVRVNAKDSPELEHLWQEFWALNQAIGGIIVAAFGGKWDQIFPLVEGWVNTARRQIGDVGQLTSEVDALKGTIADVAARSAEAKRSKVAGPVALAALAALAWWLL